MIASIKKYQHCFSVTISVTIITTNVSKHSHWSHEHQTPNHFVLFYLILLREFKLSCYSRSITNLDHVNTQKRDVGDLVQDNFLGV